MPAPVISLTTDFGSVSGYAGTVKGVLLGINPASTIVDISHDVPAQDIAHGAFVLGSAYRYFEDSTIHLAVVDPGVGSSRSAILLVTPEGRFLAPNNGLLTYVVMGQTNETSVASGVGFMEPALVAVPEGCTAYAITRPEYWRHPVSRTFHARDIFAPVAAHLSLGTAPHTVGEQVDTITVLNACSEPDDKTVLRGQVIFVDGFGNLVTNLRSNRITSDIVSVEICGETLSGVVRTFAETDGLMALHGSHGYLEVAERNGNASRRLQARVGDSVKVLPANHCGNSADQP